MAVSRSIKVLHKMGLSVYTCFTLSAVVRTTDFPLQNASGGCHEAVKPLPTQWCQKARPAVSIGQYGGGFGKIELLSQAFAEAGNSPLSSNSSTAGSRLFEPDELVELLVQLRMVGQLLML